LRSYSELCTTIHALNNYSKLCTAIWFTLLFYAPGRMSCQNYFYLLFQWSIKDRTPSFCNWHPYPLLLLHDLMDFWILNLNHLRSMLRKTWSILINHNKWIVSTNPNTIHHFFWRSCDCLRDHSPRFGSAWTRKASF